VRLIGNNCAYYRRNPRFLNHLFSPVKRNKSLDYNSAGSPFPEFYFGGIILSLVKSLFIEGHRCKVIPIDKIGYWNSFNGNDITE
ncbi:MAG: hypothetical protein P8Y60_08640, partial [Calditrichota bacterium]